MEMGLGRIGWGEVGKGSYWWVWSEMDEVGESWGWEILLGKVLE